MARIRRLSYHNLEIRGEHIKGQIATVLARLLRETAAPRLCYAATVGIPVMKPRGRREASIAAEGSHLRLFESSTKKNLMYKALGRPNRLLHAK